MNYEKKKKIYFTLIMLIFLLTIGLVTFVLIYFNSVETKLLLSAIILLLSFLILSTVKGRFDIANTLISYHKLDTNREGPLMISKSILTNYWIDYIKRNGYSLYKNFAAFDIYYRFETINYKSKRNKTMIIVVMIKNQTSFDSKTLAKSINDMGEDFYKKERFNNHIVLQFKNTKEYTKELVFEADQVLFKKQNNRNYIVIINVLQNTTDNTIYFLHNNNYSPNRFYTYGINEIKKLSK